MSSCQSETNGQGTPANSPTRSFHLCGVPESNGLSSGALGVELPHRTLVATF